MEQDSPIFVRGLSRSGGTLMVTMLDAHPDIAMSYELYPNLLEPDKGDEIELDEIIKTMSASRNLNKAAKKIANRGLYTFFIRCGRGGLTTDDIVDLLNRHKNKGYRFIETDHRLRFIESCCRRKMSREQKKRWGLKCSGAFDDYLSLFPKACFLNMVRDGRDVLASQMNTGSFNTTPEKLGQSWSNAHEKFGELVQRNDVKAYEVIYETLVTEPDIELRKICTFLGIEFTESMLEYYKKDLTIYNTNHLSLKRISKPVDRTSIGRWRKELKPEEVERFCLIADEEMRRFNYLPQEPRC